MTNTTFFGGNPAMSSATTVQEAMKIAGQDWKVVERPIFDNQGNSLAQFGKAVVREDNGAILGITGPRTTVLQNHESWSFFEKFIEAKECSFDTAGTIGGGKKIWALAKINRENSVIAGDDEVAKYVLLSNSHNGSTSVRVGFTPIRVICQNTLVMAHKSDASSLIRIRHTKQVRENVMVVRDAINIANQSFEANADMLRAMANKYINQSDVRKYVREVFDIDSVDPSKQSQKVLEQVVGLFECGKGNDRPAVRGTVYALYNGVTEFLSHKAGRSDETRLDSLWFGANASVNAKAFELALQLAV